MVDAKGAWTRVNGKLRRRTKKSMATLEVASAHGNFKFDTKALGQKLGSIIQDAEAIDTLQGHMVAFRLRALAEQLEVEVP